MCNILDTSVAIHLKISLMKLLRMGCWRYLCWDDGCVMYWMMAIRLKISLTKLLMKILVSGWTYNVLDGGDRCVTYGIVKIPVSGWALLCWRYQCQDGHWHVTSLEIPRSGWPSLCWRYQCQEGRHFVGDTSIRMAVTLLEIPASGWSLLCWRYQCQDGCCFVGDTSIRMDLFIMICIYSELDALIVCI